MGQVTGITWTDHTFNPVWGCAKISPGCDNCYAATFAKRVGQKVWGTKTQRREFGEKHWNDPRKWNRQAEKEGRKKRVFCASMADVFDSNWPPGVRDRLWALIRDTSALDWQVLTKRPENIEGMLPKDWGQGYDNVWLGVTTENQEYADRRLPILLRTPAKTRFASYEPALELVSFRQYADLDWIIIGGESGPRARSFDPQWALDVIAQCRALDVSCFHKQMGEPWARAHRATQRHGADPSEWAAAYRVQQFPRPDSIGRVSTGRAPSLPLIA